jgi:E3 ubiquitin-protein ligase UBR4
MEVTSIIIRYIIKRFDSPNAPVILLKALKSLCEAHAGLENVQAYSSLKYMKYPESSKANGSGSDKDNSPKSEVKRSRSELSVVIMQQLAQPLSQGTVPLTNFSETQFDFTVSLNASSTCVISSDHQIFLGSLQKGGHGPFKVPECK